MVTQMLLRLILSDIGLCIIILIAVPWQLSSWQVSGTSSPVGCYKRNYTYTISIPFTTDDNEVLPCQGEVTVDACWGRCDSSEIADYRIPYKLSSHPVCTYAAKTHREVSLEGEHCHPRHPEPRTVVFDATECVCKRCSSGDTSCENMM